jgi:drug/metabolite transporter (DMT)-like permease
VVTLRARRRRTGPAVPRGRLLLAVLGWGVLWFGLYNLSFNTAERHLDAGTTSFLVNLSPILVAVLAGVLLREGFPARLVIGLVIALAGVGGIAAAGATGQGSVLGVVLGVTSAVLYAFGAISQKRILRSVDALTMTWLGSAASVLVLLPFAGQLLSQAADASVDQIALVAYLGLGPTVVGFLAWAFVLARVSAGRTASTTYVVPVVVLVMAWAVLGEVPPLGAVAGGTLALLGVAVSTAPLPHGRRKGGDTA